MPSPLQRGSTVLALKEFLVSLLAAITRIDLTPAEEADLVRVVRETTSAQVADLETGETITRYFPTAEQEAALNSLIACYIQDIRRAAKSSKALDQEDAEALAVEKFIGLARDKSRSNERLAGFVSKAMVNAIKDADSENAAMRIPPRTLRTFFALVKETGSLNAAYLAAKEKDRGIDAITVLAVARTLNASSIEALAAASDDDDSADYVFVPDETPGPEEIAVQADLIRYLFSLVPEVQEQILRLAYGFTDAQTEALRVKHGYKFDEVLSDAQISPVVAMGRVTVNRTRNAALRTMHAAIQDSIESV